MAVPLTINTNIPSLNAQRMLNRSQGALGVAVQRLSSGLRINSARDDAAGLAISERMTSQIRGINQATRNANDGISLAQTAEGALASISNDLQRIRELAVQSRNATNSTEDRAALQLEAASLSAEIDRVAVQTSFNGLKLIDGSFTNKVFQVGANVDETIAISAIVDAQVSALGTWNSVSVNNSSAAGGAFSDVRLDLGGEEYTLQVDGTTVFSQVWSAGIETVTAADIDGASGLGNATVQSNLAAAGITVSGSASSGDLRFERADGASFDVVIARGNFSHGGGFAGADFADGTNTINNGAPSVATTGFTGLDISTVIGADNAMLAMDGALAAVNAARATLGAIQNRFESVIANTQSSAENLSASRSRIVDADFAAETAALTRAQILQQAGIAMTAQANSLPNSVLTLLG